MIGLRGAQHIHDLCSCLTFTYRVNAETSLSLLLTPANICSYDTSSNIKFTHFDPSGKLLHSLCESCKMTCSYSPVKIDLIPSKGCRFLQILKIRGDKIFKSNQLFFFNFSRRGHCWSVVPHVLLTSLQELTVRSVSVSVSVHMRPPTDLTECCWLSYLSMSECKAHNVKKYSCISFLEYTNKENKCCLKKKKKKKNE